MFRLTLKEWQTIRSQIVTASEAGNALQSQAVTASYQAKRNTNTTPYAFTEQGVAMLYMHFINPSNIYQVFFY